MDISYGKNIKNTILNLPISPGIYKYFDANSKLIYIGKAKNLKNRVSSYFNNKKQYGKTKVLVSKVVKIEFIVVETELDALLLENSLIKEHQPKYNIQLKDDKTYPWICIKKEPFPRIFSTRNIYKDGSEYFGPYASVKMMNTLLDLSKRLYPLRNCNLNLTKNNIRLEKFKVCLEYHIGNCKGPCENKQSEEEYNEYISEIRQVLKGNTFNLIKELKLLMQKAAENLEFENAQLIKSKLELLENYQAKSTVVSATITDLDVFGYCSDVNSGYVNYLKIINGAIVQGHTIQLKKKLEETDEELLLLGLTELRNRFVSSTKSILIPFKIDSKFDDIKTSVPQIGDKKHLIDLATRNAKYFMLEKHKHQKSINPQKNSDRILKTLQQDLRMNELPVHIECFDNSNFQGTNAVAACVVFKNAKPSSKDYRHFNIKTVEGPDDFASMEEVVYRRYSRMLSEKKTLPQLIVIDGGKGQLGSALKSLDSLGIRGKIAIIGIAKRLEEIYFPGDSVPLYIDKRSESLKLIQHLRNEAHRFGITHHRNKRSKGAITSQLDSIKGVGDKTKTSLLKHFKTISRIKESEKEELEKVIGKAKAKLVFEHFNK